MSNFRKPSSFDLAEPLQQIQFAVRGVAWGGVLKRIAVGFVALTLIAIVGTRFWIPPFSAEMVRQKFYGNPVRVQYVPLEQISPELKKAVIIAEDARFCLHSGVDWRQVEKAWQDAIDGDAKPRGASTITMQMVKNLFLWSDRSYLRKAIELPLAFMVDLIWPKRRQLEVYLNIVEWGPGIYGAEMAARHHFRKSAARLTTREAAQLAASLPNPIVRRAGRPGPHTRRIAAIIHKRMRSAGPYVRCAK